MNEALPKLSKLGIPTKRPDDYFAEMVKTDDHMQRVKFIQILNISLIKSLCVTCTEQCVCWGSQQKFDCTQCMHTGIHINACSRVALIRNSARNFFGKTWHIT